MSSQREQYGVTIHLFIGMGRSPCEITLMPFTFANNYIVVHRGLNSLFIFKSVSFFCYHAEALLRTASALRYPSYSSCFSMLWFQLKSEGTCSCTVLPETLLNHVFEDLRKPKAPNRRGQRGKRKRIVSILGRQATRSVKEDHKASKKQKTLPELKDSAPEKRKLDRISFADTKVHDVPEKTVRKMDPRPFGLIDFGV
jgi:hypothetical protein